MSEPRPPFADQNIEPPGLEDDLDPQPRYQAPDYRAAGKLQDKVALITGGDSGIGRAVANLFAREGADVAIVYLQQEETDARKTREIVEQSGRRALLIAGDVSDPSFCVRAVQSVVRELGGLNVLVNNAAYQRHRKRLEELSIEQWETTFRTNIFGYFYMVRAAADHLGRGDSIINTGSITGLEGSGGLLDYASTKGAIHAFTKSLAQQFTERGIRVNCVAPGPVWTPLNPAERNDVEDFGSGTPYGRPAQPEEIAPSYVYFASEADSHYVTGHVLPLLGGGTVAG